MYTIDEGISLDDYYAFKSSPESCSGTSCYTDYLDLHSDEDFLQQLSHDLDIPLLLNQGEDELTLLRSILDKSPDEILSEISVPPPERCDIEDQFTDLQHMNLKQWGPDAFPNLKSEATSDLSDSSLDSASSSPVQSLDSGFLDGVKSEPSSPQSSPAPQHIAETIVTTTCENKFNSTNKNLGSHKNNKHSSSPSTAESPLKRMISIKRVAIQPKSPYARPVNSVTTAGAPNGKVVILNNHPNLGASSGTRKVVMVPIGATVLPQKTAPLPAVSNVGNVSNISSNPVSAPPVVIKTEDSHNLLLNINNLDSRALKRQQRKIKNRESACLSRKKKKDYLTALENQVADLRKENTVLKMQNMQLKERLSIYEGRGASGNPIKSLKSGVMLCMFLLVVGFNQDFIRSPFVAKNRVGVVENDVPKVLDHHSRNLLWSSEDPLDNNQTNFLPFSMCPAAINQTESARLVLELERWIGIPKSPPKKFASDTNTPEYTTEPTKPKFKITKKQRKQRKYDGSILPKPSIYTLGRNLPRAEPRTGNELQVFAPTLEQLYSEFFEAINRQDDTYYVVSFSDHNMLLPALVTNKTRRPKMSLIMPTLLPNGSNSTHPTVVPLMQIDCEVLDTRLINIRYGSIPRHLRTNDNATDFPKRNSDDSNQDNATDYGRSKEAYKPYFIKQSSIKPSGVYNIH